MCGPDLTDTPKGSIWELRPKQMGPKMLPGASWTTASSECTSATSSPPASSTRCHGYCFQRHCYHRSNETAQPRRGRLLSLQGTRQDQALTCGCSNGTERGNQGCSLKGCSPLKRQPSGLLPPSSVHRPIYLLSPSRVSSKNTHPLEEPRPVPGIRPHASRVCVGWPPSLPGLVTELNLVNVPIAPAAQPKPQSSGHGF